MREDGGMRQKGGGDSDLPTVVPPGRELVSMLEHSATTEARPDAWGGASALWCTVLILWILEDLHFQNILF